MVIDTSQRPTESGLISIDRYVGSGVTSKVTRVICRCHTPQIIGDSMESPGGSSPMSYTDHVIWAA